MVNYNYGEEYFQSRNLFPSKLFKGKDLSGVKYPFWDRLIKSRVPKGRLLDVGFGEGYFLKWAEKRGYETYGVDAASPCPSIAKVGLHKSKLYMVDIGAAEFEENYFDVVTYFDVLEHLKLPQSLEEPYRNLRTGGLLVASVPNLGSIGIEIKQGDWFGFRDDTHVTLLSEDEWVTAFWKAGFKVKEVFGDILWDPPYVGLVPNLIQETFFKSLLLMFYQLPVTIPRKYSENLYIVAEKV